MKAEISEVEALLDLDSPEMLTKLLAISPDSRIVQTYEPFVGLPTGSLALDYALGGKGLVRGGYTLFAGEEGSGKTTLAMLCAITSVLDGLKVAVLDMEYRWNVEYANASQMGLPSKNYTLLNPLTAEDALNFMTYLARQHYDLIIVDSIAAMSPRAELESEIDDQQVMLINRILSSWFRRNGHHVALGQTAVLFITQLRSGISANPKYPVTTRYGGRALRHYTSIGLDFHRPEMTFAEGAKADAKAKRNPTGMIVHAKTWKNTVGQNFRPLTMRLRFQPGLEPNLLDEVADYGKAFRVLTGKNGGPIAGGSQWFYQGVLLGKTRAEAIASLGQMPEVALDLVQVIRTTMADVTAAPLALALDDGDEAEA